MKAEDYAPLVIDAASIDTRPNVYYLMPFAERLSFVAQQIRALNLVWALAEMQKIQTNSHAAVIGAGLSGVTAACALAAYGCRVSVYEKSERPMWRQSETSHRLVHPEINYWPGGSPLTHTTSLPMLEWYFNECSEVIDLIRQQYEEIERANPLLNFFCSHSVTNVRSTSSELDGLVAVIATPPCNEPVHLAIVAVGFDEDRQWLNLPRVDYWKSDDLERDSLSRAFEHFIISGCGDGGMIDALRCSYKFDKGRLAVDLATKLDASGLSEDLRDAERSSQRVRYGKYEALVSKILGNTEATNIKQLLISKINPHADIVKLLDSALEAPCDSRAAPIHKLMVHFAIRYGTINFIRGQLEECVDAKSYKIQDLVLDPSKVKFVIRHGAGLLSGIF